MRKNKTKEYGQIYTPSSIVTKMLDFIGYTGGNIVHHHIIDNSCGEGAFLEQIVQRYCSDYIQIYGYEQATYEEFSQSRLQKDLETYIHGIEIEEKSREKCIENLNTVLRNRGLNFKKPTNWDIRLGNTLEIDDFDCKMDYVVGNPPYVRVHNVKDDEKMYDCLKNFSFSSEGSSDLYLAFCQLPTN